MKPRLQAVYGNPLLALIQHMNLALLEVCRSLSIRTRWARFFAMLIAYPLCLINNLLALPMMLLHEKGASCFGFFVVAEQK